MTFKILFLGSFFIVSVFIYARHGEDEQFCLIIKLSTRCVVDFVETNRFCIVTSYG